MRALVNIKVNITKNKKTEEVEITSLQLATHLAGM